MILFVETTGWASHVSSVEFGPDLSVAESEKNGIEIRPTHTSVKLKEPEQCIETLSGSRGGTNVNQYLIHSVSQDPTFVKYLVTIMFVESSYNPTVISDKEAYGLMQLTQGAVDDASSYCGLPPISVRSMLVPKLAIQYGSCYLKKLYWELGKDWTKVLITYNGGYKQLDNYMNDDTVASESINYLYKVHSAFRRCSRTKDKRD